MRTQEGSVRTLSGAVPGMPTAPRTPYDTNFGLLQAFALSFTWSPRGQSWIEIKLMPGKKAVALQPLCRHLLHHVLECVSQNTHTRNRVFVGVRHSRLQVIALCTCTRETLLSLRSPATVLRAPLKRDDLRLNVIAFRVPNRACLLAPLRLSHHIPRRCITFTPVLTTAICFAKGRSESRCIWVIVPAFLYWFTLV